MKILLVYTNINGYHQDGYADGIAIIMAVTKKAGHDVRYLRIMKKSDYYLVDKTAKEFMPDVVGFTSVSSQFSVVTDLADIVKKISPKIINVCGGVHPTLYPQCVLENKSIDLVFIGDSEFAFLDFLEKLKNNQSWKDCDNIAYNDNGKLKKNKLKPLLSNEELELLPHPDRTGRAYADTLQHTGLAHFHFTRGCPFTCTYCSNIGLAKVYGSTRYNIRQASPEYAIQEIEETIKEHPKIGPVYKIFITDDIFGLNKKWRREFLALYRERIKIPFICLLRCDVPTEDTMQDLANSYCARIQFGVESGNDYIRNVVMDRDMPRETIVNAFKLADKYGIETSALNVIGAPGETKEMLMDTVKLNREINPTANSGANIFYPYIGTPLGDKSFDEGLVNLKKYNDFTNERRESVMNYPEEWLKTLKYYKANWENIIYPFTYRKNGSNTFREFKQMIRGIPFIGPIIRNYYQKTKQEITFRLHNIRKKNKL